MELNKNKIVTIKEDKTEEFLQFLKEQKEKNVELKKRFEAISNHIIK